MDGDSSAKFIGSLTKFLQSLCNGYVEFQRGVELVGHIYLSIDTGEKVDYILHEKVSKNDENSVTFVSNSFHAQPQDKDKAKEPPATGNAKAGKSENLQADDDDDDDDDIMIVDQSSQGVIGSTNSGSIASRGVKRMSSPGSDHRHGQRVRISLGSSSSSAHNMSGHSYGSGNRQHSGRPSATVTSQGASQNENLNISEVKLEQISKDELLSLASQVGDGTSGPSQTSSAASHSQSQLSGSSRGDAAMWVKQEVPDDGGGTDAGWPQERDDSNSNSGSNLYPVMLHPNPSAFPPSSIPGYSGPSGSGNQPAFPMPGSSQDMSGLDPAGFTGKIGPFSTPLETEAQRRKGSFMYCLPLPRFGAQAFRQRRQTKGYIPTSMLNEEEKAQRRERVRLQVRAYRMRKRQQRIEQQSDTSMYDIPLVSTEYSFDVPDEEN